MENVSSFIYTLAPLKHTIETPPSSYIKNNLNIDLKLALI